MSKRPSPARLAALQRLSLDTPYTPLERYGIALLLSLLALTCWHLGIDDFGLSPFFLYLAAVTVASGLGGLGPGVLVIVFGVVASNFAYAIPGYYVLHGPRGALQLALFLFVSVGIMVLQRERLRLTEAERTSRVVAERLRAEQAAMMEQMTEAVLVVDPEGVVLYLNEAARSLFAAPEMNGVPVQHMGDWLRSYDLEGKRVPVDEFAMPRVVRGETFTNVERIIERPNGCRATVMINARQVRGPGGGVLGALATIRDVTQERELERQRQLLLSAMVHDLKSPLGTIKGMSQLLHRRVLRTPGLAEQPRHELVDGLRSIDQKVSVMAHLIDDLVESERRNLEPHFQEHDLLGMVRSVCREINESEQGHTIEVRTNLTELVGEWDSDRLERALQNLVRNAVKYSPAGGTVRVWVMREECERQDEAVVLVEDQGIGIPEADQVRIFERFYRAHNAIAVAPGTGIGLAAVRQTVESHGGTIELESVEGQGTTVCVRLPLTRP